MLNYFIMFLQPAVHATKLCSNETILQGLGCDSGLALGLFPGQFWYLVRSTVMRPSINKIIVEE